MHSEHAFSVSLHADRGCHHTLTTQTWGQMPVLPNGLLTRVSQSPSAKLYSDLTLRQTSWNHSLLTLFLFFSVRPCQLTTDVCQCNCTHTHTHSNTHTHTHKADKPCKSRIILWSWFSSTLVPAAMAPPLAPWQPGVTGSYKVCWIRKSEPVRNKRRITAPSLFSYGHIWSTQTCVRMRTLLNIFAAKAV